MSNIHTLLEWWHLCEQKCFCIILYIDQPGKNKKLKNNLIFFLNVGFCITYILLPIYSK